MDLPILRTRVCGQFAAERKLQELAEHSMNEFAAIDIKTGRSVAEPKTTVKVSSKSKNRG
jgi:hypothetical protein